MDNLHSLSITHLRLSSDKQKLLLLISPVEKEIQSADIIELVKDSEYKNLKIDKQGLIEAVQHFQKIKQSENNNPDPKTVIIAERCDAKLSITLDPLKMVAKAQIISAFGGMNITTEEVMTALKERNIKVGINSPAIKLLLDKSTQSVAGTSFQITIAKGKSPIKGQDAYFSPLLPLPKQQLIESISEDYGSVDMNHAENIIVLQAGTELIRKYPALAGEDGFTVTGEVIPHEVGKDIPFCIGDNTEISKSDSNILVASISGTPVAIDVGMKIEKSLILDDIDKDSPPIIHHGTLIIRGDVPTGTQITVTGDITVIGFIKSSNVKCSGDLFVSKGILGDKLGKENTKFSTKIECGGSIYANFVQFSDITVEQDLNLQYQLIHSTVFCGGYITVKDKENKKGTIFGGYLSSRKGIRTVTLGARADIKTKIDLNSYYSRLIHDKKKLQLFIMKIQKKIINLQTAQDKLNNSKNTEKTIQLNKRLTLTISEFKNKLVMFSNMLIENQNKIQQYLNTTAVIALKSVYSNVYVLIGKSVFRSTKQYGATTIHVKNKKLIAESYLS